MIWLGLAHAATLSVPGTHDTLEAACSAASSGDVIEVTSAESTYGAQCHVKVPLTIRGVGDHPDVPSIEVYSTGTGTLIENVSGTETLGWPFLLSAATVTLRDVRVVDSEYAAVGAYDTVLLVEDSWFEGNTFYGSAGVIYGDGDVSITVEGTTFQDNTSEDEAGAIYVNGGSLVVRDSHFHGNTGPEAAAIRSSGDSVRVEGSGFVENTSAGALIRTDSVQTVVLSGVSVVENQVQGQGYIAAQYHDELRVESSWFCGNAPMTGASTGIIRSLGGPLGVTGSGFMNHADGNWMALITAVDLQGTDEDISLIGNTFLANKPDEGFVFTTQGALTMEDNLLVQNADAQDDDGEITYVGGGNVWIDTWAEDAIASQFTDEVTDIADPGWDADFDRTDCSSLPYLAPDSDVLGVGAFGERPDGDTGPSIEPGDTWVHGGCATTGLGPWILGLLLLARRGMLST